jgi:hypothetical protein
MRRRLREQKRMREALLLDLGALVFELQRHGRREPELLQAKAAELSAVDNEVRGLANALDVGQSVLELVATGVAGSCGNCGSLLSTDARYCQACGAPALPSLGGQPTRERGPALARGDGGGGPALARGNEVYGDPAMARGDEAYGDPAMAPGAPPTPPQAPPAFPGPSRSAPGRPELGDPSAHRRDHLGEALGAPGAAPPERPAAASRLGRMRDKVRRRNTPG